MVPYIHGTLTRKLYDILLTHLGRNNFYSRQVRKCMLSILRSIATQCGIKQIKDLKHTAI